MRSWYNDAIQERKEESPIKSLLTETPVKVSDMYLHITNDPMEVALKATGRRWAKDSCERIGGEHDEGFITDIKENNLIAFVLDENGTPVSRTMVRWGLDEDGNVCGGIEPKFYGNSRNHHLYEAKISDHIYDLMFQNGVLANSCTTPYIYRGYSDAIRKGNVNVEYKINKRYCQRKILTKDEQTVSKFFNCLLYEDQKKAVEYDSFRKLFDDKDNDVLFELAKNKYAPRFDEYKRLFTNEELWFRKELAKNPNATRFNEYKKLFTDEAFDIRSYAAENPNATKFEEYKKLFTDDEKIIREDACNNLERYQKNHNTTDTFGCLD